MPAETIREVERAILDTDLFRTADVVFEFNSDRLLPASAAVLNSVGVVMRRYPDLKLEVRGHTDSVGPEEYNAALSLRRAESVCEYLSRSLGVDATRLIARGFGESTPIADNATATGRTMNRRVEFVVIP